ncbi:hypothetical protein chiPu_0007955 [Chiloscyllium punctatum]|uniref:Reverse transcriptase domain-containing protein n=1 Tax=Chiloscyllium punctatum TaxID=137246 RepID=A0A401SGP6_CHIPU|nr:hypothetical protein [Chiloscyllium punctatum]
MVDEGRAAVIVHTGFSKAFDKVPYGRLLGMVKLYGMPRELANWIHNWLDGRKQRVVVEGRLSVWRHVTSDMPQETVLGPLLFAIYNDLDENIHRMLCKFADDTKIGGIVESEEGYQKLQQDLNQLENCMRNGKWSLI